MKNRFITTLLVFHFTVAYSQTTSPTTISNSDGTTTYVNTNSSTDAEKNLNQKLMDNGAAAQKILEDSQANKAPTSIKILSNGGSSSTKTSSANLTDQDKQLSENYVDQVAANKILKEKCSGDMAQVCNGQEGNHKVMGMDPSFVKALTQAYATIGAVGDFLPLSAKAKTPEAPTKKEGETPPAKEGEAPKGDAAKDGKDTKKETKSDYCKYIPVATETIATITQKNTVADLNTGAETSQKEALEKAAKSHDGRASQAQMQAGGWFGGAACYAYMGTFGGAAWDTSLIVKLGAATLLGTFYQSEVAANKDYAAKTRAIEAALPGKGYCNPVTENDCYCAETEHANDPTYC